MPLTKQFNQLDPINNGTSAANNFKMSDSIPAQHSDVTGGVNKLVKRTFAQMLCEPVAVSNSNKPNNGAYTATCQNYPDFAVSYQDEQMSTHYYVGLKIRVIFNYGITYGSVSGGTYPTLNINSSGALPLLAQGKTMASGAASNGQSLELTLIPYGNGYAWDADSNVRESTSDYTIYTDGKKTYKESFILEKCINLQPGDNTITFDTKNAYMLVASGSNFGFGVCFVVQGYNTAVFRQVVVNSNLNFGTSSYVDFRSMNVKNNGDGVVELKIYKIV